MPKVILNPMIKQLSGKMGEIVFRTTPGGTIFISKRPDMSHVKWSPAQKAHRERFKQAVAYAKAVKADPDLREVYEKMAAEKHKRPHDMAVSDYLKGNNLFMKKGNR